MTLKTILSEIDKEISKLTQARTLLAGDAATKRKPGRPKATATITQPAKAKRNISPEGRKRIADAVKKRWALQKKAAAK